MQWRQPQRARSEHHARAEIRQADRWWEGPGAELLAAELDAHERESVEAALASSPTVRKALARMLPRLGPGMRGEMITHFAEQLPMADLADQALLWTIAWLADSGRTS